MYRQQAMSSTGCALLGSTGQQQHCGGICQHCTCCLRAAAARIVGTVLDTSRRLCCDVWEFVMFMAGIRVPPSLVNIYKELGQDIRAKIPKHGCLKKVSDCAVLGCADTMIKAAQSAQQRSSSCCVLTTCHT